MEEEAEDTCANCTQCQRESRCRGSRSRGSSATRRRDRRRRRAGGSTGRHSHRSRSSRRNNGNSNRASSSRHGSRRGSPARGGSSSGGRHTVSAEDEAVKSQTGVWPHKLSFLLALVSTLLGMFNISRFAVLTIDFGAIFLLQFLVLTLVFGAPMVTLFISLGQFLGSGLIDMWRISPIFQGVGVSLMLVQGMVGVYSMIVTSWMFVYFRDSFISASPYRWSQCQDSPRCDYHSPDQNWPIKDTIPYYFANTVLHRSSIDYAEPALGHLKFQVSNHLIVIWMVVFICLSRGLRSYGKVVYIFTTLSVIGFIAFTAKVLGDFPLAEFQSWLQAQKWADFIYNSKSWVCAAKECFLVWSLLGGSILQLASHNKFKTNVKRDSMLAMLIVILFLILSGLLGVAVHRRIQTHGQYNYIPSSFETSHSYSFLEPMNRTPFPGHLDHVALRPPSDTTDHISFLAGVRILDPTRTIRDQKLSGYQVNRLATELIPTYLAVLGTNLVSPAWSVLFYFTLILLGISQCLALFHTVIQGLIAIKPSCLKNWEGSITFCVCSLGLLLGLPMATEIGIYVVYFLDYTIGCGWWAMVLYLIQIFAVLVVRGRPYGPEQISSLIFSKSNCCSGWLGTLLAFTWSVILPISLLVMSVVSFRTGYVQEMFDWTLDSGYVYLPSWVREIGSMMQLMPILIVPFVGIIQSCRYFLNDSDSMITRLERLYRPNYPTTRRPSRSHSQDVVLTNFTQEAPSPTPPAANDPPPKYTPPPSYSTATGARIARMIRQSFRRSVRRLQESRLPVKLNQALPPDYATVIIESSRQRDRRTEEEEEEEEEETYMDPLDAVRLQFGPSTDSRPSPIGADLPGPSSSYRTRTLDRDNGSRFFDNQGYTDSENSLGRHGEDRGRHGEDRGRLGLSRHENQRAGRVGGASLQLAEGGADSVRSGRGGGASLNLAEGGSEILKPGRGGGAGRHLSKGGAAGAPEDYDLPPHFDSISDVRSRGAHPRQRSFPSSQDFRFGMLESLPPVDYREEPGDYTLKLHPQHSTKDDSRGSRDPGEFFQIRVPEDDFGEIVFVETEGERIHDFQEEAVNLNVISTTGTRSSLGDLSASFRGAARVPPRVRVGTGPPGVSINMDTTDSVI